MHNSIDAAIALNVIHASVSFHRLQLHSPPLTDAILIVATSPIARCILGLEKRDGESAGLEDAHDLLDHVCGLAACLAGGYVSFERRIGAVWLGRNVYVEIMSRTVARW